MTIRCVVFDIDDTLYLERDYVRSGFDAVDAVVRQRCGVDGFSGTAWSLFERGERGDIFDRALAALGVVAEAGLVAALVDAYRAHAPSIRLLDDARVCIERLHGRATLAGLTDGPPASQRAKIRALGLEAWLFPIVVTAELGPGLGKPHPVGFRYIEEATGARGASCLYVADNPAKDFAGPRALGWRTVRIRRPGGLHVDQPSRDDVDEEITTLAELLP